MSITLAIRPLKFGGSAIDLRAVYLAGMLAIGGVGQYFTSNSRCVGGQLLVNCANRRHQVK